MIHLDIDDYPKDVYNPVNPIWLTITGRWLREPAPTDSEGNYRSALAPTKSITLMNKAGEVHKFISIADAGVYLGYKRESASMGLAWVVKRRKESGWFQCKKKWYKYIDGPYGE